MNPKHLSFGHKHISVRLIVTGLVLIVATTLLIIEIAPLLPNALNWIPDDYAYFLRWGRDAQQGIFAYRYPLSADLWIFLPLSLLPSWFAIIWIVIPFIFALCILGKKGIVSWLSYPFVVHAALGQIDGWFLVPLYWLLQDHATWAGPSAAVLSLKPQLALFPVPFMIYRWITTRNWRSALLFSGTMTALYTPAFLLDSRWLPKTITEVQARANESIQMTRGATLWGWWWHGDWTILALPFLIALIVVLLLRIMRFEWKQARAVHLLGLMSVPVLYAVSFVTVIPTLKNSTRHLVAFTLVSWVCVAIDVLFQGWGGAYVLIPLTALALLAQDTDSQITPPIPTSPIARSKTIATETIDTRPRD